MIKAMIYIHGKGGSHLEAGRYRKNCPGFDIYGIDYNDYFPWVVQDKILACYNEIYKKYGHVYLLANSVGAYFAMHTLQDCEIEKALFISPILDMEKLILDMMSWTHVSEKELAEKGEMVTDFGETLSWKYLCFVRENPIVWDVPTEILYADQDNLTSRQTVNEFMEKHPDARLTVMKNGEHWFHTDEQLEFLDCWMRKAVQ